MSIADGDERGRIARSDHQPQPASGPPRHIGQLPLPGHLNAAAILDRIDPAKDVDGFHPVKTGWAA
jgi:hypothetical protein